MYTKFFSLSESPFSLTPDPRFLYMSERHREGLAHLLYGVQQPGGFIQLTGEIGCGKTMLCRCLVNQLPPETDIALILNPRLTVVELLASFCDELHVPYPQGTESIKVLIDALNRHLLDAHAEGRRTVLVIDEAQNLHRDVLEQIRLLTNLETEQEKLLKIILIGQPELLSLLKDPSLRQLAQRVTARYHLLPLSRHETYAYIRHRLFVAGQTDPPFSRQALREIYRLTGGVPRRINILCDRALLGAYTLDKRHVSAGIVRRAGREIREISPLTRVKRVASISIIAALLILLGAVASKYLPVMVSGPEGKMTAAEDLQTGEESRDADTLQNASVTESNPAVPSAGAVLEGTIQKSPEKESDGAKSLAAGPASTRPSPEEADPPESPEGIPSSLSLSAIISDPSLRYSLVSSFNSLYATWDIPLRIQPSEIGCSAARTYGFECLFMKGDWLKIRRLDIPVILSIQIPDGEKRYAALIGLNGNEATLHIGQRRYVLTLQEIDRFWDGNFIVIWIPPFPELSLLQGMQGAPIAWVRQTLDAYEGRTVPSVNPNLFDSALRQRIIEFQKTQALIQDGRIGPETLIRLSIIRDTNNIPLLSRHPDNGEKL